MKANIAPYPPCHRDFFAANMTRSVGWLRRVTLTYFIAVPLAKIQAIFFEYSAALTASNRGYIDKTHERLPSASTATLNR
jgi:hypothetical protein